MYMTCAGLFILCKTFQITRPPPNHYLYRYTYAGIYVCYLVFMHSITNYIYICLSIFTRGMHIKWYKWFLFYRCREIKIFAKFLISFYNLMGFDIWFLLCKYVDNHITMSSRKNRYLYTKSHAMMNGRNSTPFAHPHKGLHVRGQEVKAWLALQLQKWMGYDDIPMGPKSV